MEELAYFGRIHVLAGDEFDAGVDPFIDGFTLKMSGEGHNRFVAHEDGVLDDEALDIAIFQIEDRLGAGVEAEHFDLATGLADVAEAFGHGDGGRFVGAEDAVDLVSEAIEKVLGGLIGGLAGGTGVLIGGDELYAFVGFQGVEETGLAGFGAGGADGIAEEDDVSFAIEKFGHVIAGHFAAEIVVSGDEADVFVRLEIGIHDDDGDAGLGGGADGDGEGLGVEGGEDDSADVTDGKILNDLDLLIAVVFAEGTLPDDFGFDAGSIEFLLGFDGPGVDGLPELVGGALGDDGNGVAIGGPCHRRQQGEKACQEPGIHG